MTKQEYEKEIARISDEIIKLVCEQTDDEGLQYMTILYTAKRCELLIREQDNPELNNWLDTGDDLVKLAAKYKAGKWNEC